MINLDANELLSAFSLALDVAENQPWGHAQRTAYIALRIAEQIQVPQTALRDIYTAALLHDIGAVDAKVINYDDQVLGHCFSGAEIVNQLPFPTVVSEYVRWHHANWDGTGAFGRDHRTLPLGAQIICLADQLDLRIGEMKTIYFDRSRITQHVKEASGYLYNPDLVDAFLQIQEKEQFWLDLSSLNLAEILKEIQPVNELVINIDIMEEIAGVFAKIIDFKSHFTHYHSQGLSEVVSGLGAFYGYDQETVQLLRISGLLHDLGKLAIPTSILDKPGKLEPMERTIIKSHAYYTKQILGRVKGFETIKEWAANHHETLDGKGYPEGLGAADLTMPERMMAVCDIYQALTEERPYRTVMPQSKVFEIINDGVKTGKLCSEAFVKLKQMVK